MNYLSVCSGIESATVAWHPLGWRQVAFSEIEKFPSRVLAHHYPDVPNWGDMTKFQEWPDADINVLVGGTPCQDFSIAGLRSGLDGERGELTLVYAQIARRYRPAWLVWENVPGVLSNNAGRDFASVLGVFSGQRVHVPKGGWQSAGVITQGPGAYGLAWRVLDAQFVRVESHPGAVPQRRRRVFVVGYIGDWRRAAAVLFERESLSGHSPPRREKGKAVAPTLSARTQGGGGLGTDFDLDGGLIASTGDISHCLNAGGMGRIDYESETLLVSHALRGEGFDASEDGTGRGTPIVPVAYRTTGNDGCYETGDVVACLNTASDPNQNVLVQDWRVRRLLPEECESLQGFPQNYTRIAERTYKNKPRSKHARKYADLYERNINGSWTRFAADGPRYKALGNSMAVPVMSFIGQRIDAVNSIRRGK